LQAAAARTPYFTSRGGFCGHVVHFGEKRAYESDFKRKSQDGKDVHDGVIDKVRDGRKDPSVT
jgi:hypothetical protein